jgi:DNA-binding NarL/FixJ family response regulator
VKYVHAGNVLPADLVEKVRRHHVGLIYFPADHEFYERRRRQIMSLHAEGLSTREIAERVHLSRRRVQQVVRNATRVGLSRRPAPDESREKS